MLGSTKSALIKTWALKICMRNFPSWIFSSFWWRWRLTFTTDRVKKGTFSLGIQCTKITVKIKYHFIFKLQWQPRRQSLNFLVNDCSSLSSINNQFFMLTCSKLLGAKFPIKMTRENWPNRMLWTIATRNFTNKK